MNRLAWNISANLLSNIWSTALSLLLTPLYVRLLGVEGFGLIGFYMSWIAVLGILDTGLSSTATREIAWLSARPAERGQIANLLRSLEVIYWVIILLAGAAMLSAVWYFGTGWLQASRMPAGAVRASLLLMVVSLVVQVPSGLYVGGLIGLQRQVECSALVALFGTIRAAGAAVVLITIRADVVVFFEWQIVIGALQTAVMRWSLVRALPGDGSVARFSPSALRSVRQFAGGMSIVTALSLLLAQSDKLILSWLVSLQSLGFYMLAWTVASGLSRVAGPLLHAFNPRFTASVATGDDDALRTHVRLASQLMSVLALPPAAFLAFFGTPILMAWLGDPVVAAGAAPLLAVLATGTALSACSYPPLSVLYSRGHISAVVAVNLTAVLILLPLLFIAVNAFGAMGAAYCWALYGFVTYVAYARLGFRGLPRTASWMLRDVVMPGAVACATAALTSFVWTPSEARVETVFVVAVGLVVGWGGALVVCRDLWKVAVSKLRWNATVIRSSA